MTKWEIILKDNRETDEQIDEVGNIYQKLGGVIPKACQECKKPFDSIVEKIPLKQDIPLFTCTQCEFINHGSSLAMEHMLETSHKINKTTTDRIVGYDNIITGRLPLINKIIKNNEVVDVIILCSDCHV